MPELTFPKRPYRTHGGVHAPHNKHTAHIESVELQSTTIGLISMPTRKDVTKKQKGKNVAVWGTK